MRGMLKRAPVLAVLALFAVLVCACGSTSGSGSASLPDASSLLTAASTAMRGVTSIHFALTVNGELAGVPVHAAQGDLNSSGQATGTATLTEFGQLVQVEFVLFGKSLYVKGPTGGYQKLSISAAGELFDPSAILDPNRGIAAVIGGLRDPRTGARETVDGVDTYRVSGQVAKDVAATLVPGISSDVTATLWLRADDQHLPIKVEFTVPGSGSAPAATVDMTISRVNQPVSVTAPA